MKWIIDWWDTFSEEHGKELFNSKIKARERLQELKDEYKENLEWEIRKAVKIWG